MSILDADKQLVSHFWYDAPNAMDLVEERASRFNLDPDLLVTFVRDGYMIVRATEQLEELVDGLVRDIDREWETQEGRAIYSGPGKRRTIMAGLDPALHRVPGYRISDAHGFSDYARRLTLVDSVFGYVNALFGEQAVAFQSLYFEWGSQQGLHRDPMFVRTTPPSALLASWLALEDIHSDAGPLLYVPGSHRYPWYEFVEGDVIVDKGNDRIEARQAFREKYLQDMAANGHQVVELTCRKGDVLIWHGGLLHGGKKHNDPSRTRKSLVTHYSVASTMTKVRNSIFAWEPDSTRDRPVQKARETLDVITAGTSRMFEAPWRDVDLMSLVGQGWRSAPDY